MLNALLHLLPIVGAIALAAILSLPAMASGIKVPLTTAIVTPAKAAIPGKQAVYGDAGAATNEPVPSGQCMNLAGKVGAGTAGSDGICLTPETLVGNAGGSYLISGAVAGVAAVAAVCSNKYLSLSEGLHTHTGASEC